MKCIHCGKMNYGDVERCFNCGTPLKQPPVQYSPQQAAPPMPPTGRVFPPQQAPPPMPPKGKVHPLQPQTRPPQMPKTPMLGIPPPVAPPPQPPPGQQQKVVKPSSGVCSQCNTKALQFFDNGLGKCQNCGRTFDWLKPQMQRPPVGPVMQPGLIGQPPGGIDRPPPEDNPFLATEDEKLSVSERKAEVDSEEVIFHDPISGGASSNDKKKGKDKKKDTSDEEELSNEQRLKMLEDRLLSGQISEEIYKKLRSKYTAKLLKSLEDQLLKGDITENEYNEKKQDLE